MSDEELVKAVAVEMFNAAFRLANPITGNQVIAPVGLTTAEAFERWALRDYRSTAESVITLVRDRA